MHTNAVKKIVTFIVGATLATMLETLRQATIHWIYPQRPKRDHPTYERLVQRENIPAAEVVVHLINLMPKNAILCVTTY